MSLQRQSFRAALVQMCSGRDVERNLADATALIREAVAQGAQYVQTPEITTLMEMERGRLFAAVRPEEGNPAVARFAALAQELGIGTFPTYDTGQRLIDRDGNVRRYSGLIPPVSICALIELGIMRWRLNATARKVPPEAPWSSADAVEWDGQTLGT